MQKITFIGDLMCEPVVLEAAKTQEGYDFNFVFQGVKDLLRESNYVIGNLETPIAGPQAGYTTTFFSFNTPEQFVDAVKAAGIHMVTTANNHCLDRGVEGLRQTARTLKKMDLPFSGIYERSDEREEAAYFVLGHTKYAVVSYTYGTNYSENKILLDEEQKTLVNLLRPQSESYFIPQNTRKSMKQRIVGKILSVMNQRQRYLAKKLCGITVSVAREDDNLNRESARPYIEKMIHDIRIAKQKADVVFFCPHVGGQYNLKPGAFSEYVVQEAVGAGCDAVIGTHAHVVQEYRAIQNIPCFFSIGNFSMSPHSIYTVQDNLPNYGIAVHLYVDGLNIKKTTFSVLKIQENSKGVISVVPVDELLDTYNKRQKIRLLNEIRQIVRVVTGNNADDIGIEREYSIS